MKRIEIRPAVWQDGKDIWRWRNDKTTRRFSFNTKFIPLKVHLIWLKRALADNNRKIFMVEKDGLGVGMVRFDIVDPKEGTALININISPDERGRGLGLLATRYTCKYAFRRLKVKRIIAKIKKENIVSLRMFVKAGFKKTIEEPDNSITTELVRSPR